MILFLNKLRLPFDVRRHSPYFCQLWIGQFYKFDLETIFSLYDILDKMNPKQVCKNIAYDL